MSSVNKRVSGKPVASPMADAMQAAVQAAQRQTPSAAVALHHHSQGIAAATGQGSCSQPAGAASEAGMAAVATCPQSRSGIAPAPVQQDGVWSA